MAGSNPFSSLPGVKQTWIPPTNPRNGNSATGFGGGGSFGLMQPGTKGQYKTEQPNFLQQLMSAAGQDLSAFKTAADKQKGLLDNQIAGMSGLVGGIGNQIRGAADQGVGDFQNLIGDIRNTSMSQSQSFEDNAASVMAGANKGADKVWANAQNVRGDLQGAYQRADAAVGTSQAAVRGYDLGVQENAIGATISGLKEHVQQQKQMIQAGLNPDGTMMTAAERQQASRNLESDTNRTVAMTAATMREQAQKTVADLTNTVASFQMGAANVRLQGAGLEAEIGRQGLAAEQLRTQTGLSLNEQRLQSQAGVRQSQQMVAGITDLMNQLRVSGKLTAFQAEMQGRTNLFGEIQSNPESVISLLPTLLMLGQVGSAPGGRTMQGFDFGGMA